MSATPRLDRVTVSRLTVDDFPLSVDERDVIRYVPGESDRLDELVRAQFEYGRALAIAVEQWRAGRDR